MDPAAFAALVEQCAPTPDLVRPLTAIVRQASAFEPLLITIEGRKPVPILASDREEAIQLTAEAIATGQRVRTGLAQLDAAETKQAGLTPLTTFDACQHITGLGRLFGARLKAASIKSSDRDQAVVRVVASFAARAPSQTAEPRIQPTASADTERSTSDASPINPPSPLVSEHPRWDVYRSGRGTSAFVYDR
ncbi:type IV secretion protein [Bradyrhizobium diazoefficiens]|nr:type IV secretion protein [Bradyrhizobium diazoefficiens]MBR0965714.1 type IV secretion protein [Bradyrhizobium diazoefficiens]MBR1008598.1 type IV secretion protein [Bradyrhizobium diazoefficiens]MBR1014653.1 type IV secretion protein [Bradyrhizobium diazoefficiens]MBR1052559.1 type IV secretion protein [Bradyrhizobium diazoefficiens]MBR1058680.1 type IV secretion protein [Bradyrhizobium diazoefficiens]